MICDSYTALTAWGTVCGAAATFLAVLVALFYPIYRERKDKLERARNLRAQTFGLDRRGRAFFKEYTQRVRRLRGKQKIRC